jgi:DNA-binding CsgD family transcriptional regulator
VPDPVFEELRRTVDAALVAGDPEAALAAIRPVARAVAAEEGAGFRALVGLLPETVWHEDAALAAAMGASYRAAGSPRGAAAIGYLHAAEAGLAMAGRDADPDRVAVWLAHAAALRALGRLDAAAAYVQRTRDLDGPGAVLSIPVRVELGARSTLEAGLLDLHYGRLARASDELRFAHGLASELTRAEHLECLGGLALLAYTDARLDTAERHIADARALATGTTLLRSTYAGPALCAEMLVAIETHDIPRATQIEAEMLRAVSHGDWEPLGFVASGYLRLIDGRLIEGLDELQRARQAFRGWDDPHFGGAAGELLRAALLVLLDHGDEAWEILRDLDPYPNHPLCPFRVTAQLRLRHGDLSGAAEALAGCEALGDEHSPRTLMDVRMLRGAIEFERGEFALSDVMVDRALVTMARTGSRAPLRAIPPGTLAALAARALDRPHSARARRILEFVVEATDGQDRLIEPLSHRELLVLAEVEKGSTVAGIAAALYISPNTVKTHLRRLYRKLGVATRTDAIRKAKSLGLGRPVTRESPE